MVLQLQSVHHPDNNNSFYSQYPSISSVTRKLIPLFREVASPFDDPGDVLSLQALDGSVDLQVLLQSDPGPQRVNLWTVTHMFQRTVHWTKLCAVVPHQHLDKGETVSELVTML